MTGPAFDAVALATSVAFVVGIIGAAAVLAVARHRAVAAAAGAPLVVVLSLAAGVWASSRAMFLESGDSETMLLVLLAAVPVALGVGLVIALRIQALNRAVARAEMERQRDLEVEAQRRELVAWVSHDLRTPLAGMRAITEALEDGIAPDPTAYLHRLRTDIGRMDAMVDDLLALSRLQSPGLRLHRQEVSLSDVVSDAVAAEQALADAAGVTLEGRSEQVVAIIDAREVGRAVSNLLVNAIRHTPTGGRVVVEVSPGPGETSVSVTDQCGGIAPEHLARVFETGWRGSEALTPGQGGAGLGLAIVRGVAQAHGGVAEVRNVGAGCRFTLRLPVEDRSATRE